jgi:methionyl-tRNA synthetase
LTFINAHFDGAVPALEALDAHAKQILMSLNEKVNEIADGLENCRLQSAANNLVGLSRIGNQYLTDEEPWKLVKDDGDKAASILHVAAQIVKALAIVSAPFIPYSAEEIWRTLKLPGSVHKQKWEDAFKPFPGNHRIGKARPLFRKIDADEQELQNRLERTRQESVKNA